MTRLRRLLLRLFNVFNRGRAESDLAREVASHLTLLEDDFQRRGMTRDDARRAARLALGGVEQTKELHRDARPFVRLDDARRDLQYAVRLLRRNPLFALTAAASLAIGIGATTTIFTVANGLLLRAPAGVGDPDRLADIVRSQQGHFGIVPASYPDYLEIRQRTTTLEGVYAYQLNLAPMSLAGAGNTAGAERIFATVVTSNYFTVLGVRPVVGRVFGAGDSEQPGASPLIVLSHRFWIRRFDADPAIVGQTLTLNGHPFTVAGVAREGFRGTSVVAPDVWIPTAMTATVKSTSDGLMMGGRLKPDVTMRQAAAEIDAISRALEREYPDGTEWRLAAASPIPANLRVVVAGFLALLMGLVAFVLIIAC